MTARRNLLYKDAVFERRVLRQRIGCRIGIEQPTRQFAIGKTLGVGDIVTVAALQPTVDNHPKRHEYVVFPTVEGLTRQRFATAHAFVTLPFVAEFLQRQSVATGTIQSVDHPNVFFQCCHIHKTLFS